MKSYLKNELGRLRSETIQHVKNNFQPNKMECDNDNICEQEDQEVSTTFCSPFSQTDRSKQDVRLKRYSENNHNPVPLYVIMLLVSILIFT